MMTSIHINEIYRYHGSIACGLSVSGPNKIFPLVVGCSIRTIEGRIIDIPAKSLVSPGLALWVVKAPHECYNDDGFSGEWRGHVIFAAYRDSSFNERLSDTGWKPWQAPWMIGASVAGLNMQDDNIREIYGKRLDVWKPL